MKSSRSTLTNSRNYTAATTIVVIVTSILAAISLWTPPAHCFTSVSLLTHYSKPTTTLSRRLRLAAAPTPLATDGDWSAYLDEKSGYVYYFNAKTGESLWEAPTNSFPKLEVLETNTRGVTNVSKRMPLATDGDWSAYLDEKTGYVYYFNAKTGESLWEPPTSSFPKVGVLRTNTPGETGTSEGGFVTNVWKRMQKVTMTTTVISTTSSTTLKDNTKGTKEPSSTVTSEESKPTFDIPKMFGQSSLQAKRRSSDKNTKNTNLLDTTGTSEVTTQIDSTTNSNINNTISSGEESTTVKTFIRDFSFSSTTFKNPFSKEVDVIIPKDDNIILQLDIASRVLPSPDKVSWGGEDAIFVSGRTFGLFDGVSGAEKIDGLPLYSKTLANEMQKYAETTGMTLQDMSKLLLKAKQYADVHATGASTALVGSIGTDGFLRILNLGDSAALVIRNGVVVARSKDISHYFDCPYQLAADSPDRPKDCTKLKTELFPKDILVVGSDGIFDNLTDLAVAALVARVEATAKPESSIASVIAKLVVEESRRVSLDIYADTPFAKLAKKNRYEEYSDGVGGKVDDISCVAIRCI